MNKRFLSVLAFAIVISGLATFIIYRLMVDRFTASANQQVSLVLVAARNLEIGAMIKDIDLRVAEWSGAVPAQAVGKKEDLLGRGVVANIYAGEPVLESRLAPKGAGAGLAATIPKGKRAVAVRVNEVVGVAGFVVPGMRVDVLINGSPPGGAAAAGTQTRTILQNIEVLSAGQNIQKDAEGKPVSVQVVNLLVTPEQAETLTLALNDTRIQLVLRNPLDTDEAKTPGAVLANLYGAVGPPPSAASLGKPKVHAAAPAPKPVAAPPPPPQPPPPPVVKTIEVLHGARKSEAKFEKKAEVKQ
jgi:pilus assembly protein CpaB